jgi:hypothetical protein
MLERREQYGMTTLFQSGDELQFRGNHMFVQSESRVTTLRHFGHTKMKDFRPGPMPPSAPRSIATKLHTEVLAPNVIITRFQGHITKVCWQNRNSCPFVPPSQTRSNLNGSWI